jgi:acyl-coenzyme A thioesterase PaaI-like protein
MVGAPASQTRKASDRTAADRSVFARGTDFPEDLLWEVGRARFYASRRRDLRLLIRLVAMPALQDTYAPNNRCFGCGPANEKGLRIKSRVEGDEVVAEWHPEPHHQAFEGILNGGICGALLDCHSNWTAAHHLMKKSGADSPPCTVTADFHVVLKRPTPMDAPLHLRAHVVESTDDRAVVEATLEANGKVTATCRGTFVAVKEGHPAYHRW